MYAQGQLPPEWSAGMPVIENILLTDCQLTGPVPPSWAEMSMLYGLNIQGNHLSGTLPDFKYAPASLHCRQLISSTC